MIFKIVILLFHRFNFLQFHFNFIKAWNDLGPDIRTAPTISSFKKLLLSNIRPIQKSLHGIINRCESSIISRLRVHFSDLHEHRFAHNFACESPMYKCNFGVESTIHLQCCQYSLHRGILLDNVSDIVGNDITQLLDDHLRYLLLFGSMLTTRKQPK